MTFFGQHRVENFFFYFSLKALTKVFKISHSKKFFLEKKFYLKIAVSGLVMTYFVVFERFSTSLALKKFVAKHQTARKHFHVLNDYDESRSDFQMKN